MHSFTQFLNHIHPLSEAARSDFEQALQEKDYAPGATVSEAGRTCKHLFFMEQGLVKLNFFKEDREFVMRFFAEGTVFTALDSFFQQQPSAYSLTTLEPSRIASISHQNLELLCHQHHSLESAYRKLVSWATTNMMHRIMEMLEDDGTERYENFLGEHRHLVDRISLGDMAKYLGISQVSLSRIRARK